jgi:hypothetical protein
MYLRAHKNESKGVHTASQGANHPGIPRDMTINDQRSGSDLG